MDVPGLNKLAITAGLNKLASSSSLSSPHEASSGPIGFRCGGLQRTAGRRPGALWEDKQQLPQIF